MQWPSGGKPASEMGPPASGKKVCDGCWRRGLCASVSGCTCSCDGERNWPHTEGLSVFGVERQLKAYLTPDGARRWWERVHPELGTTPRQAWHAGLWSEVWDAAAGGREMGGT